MAYFDVCERFQSEVEPHILKRVPRYLEVHFLEVFAARKFPLGVFHIDNDALLLGDEMVEVNGPREVGKDDSVTELSHAEFEVAVVEDRIDGGRGEIVVRLRYEVEIVVECLSLVNGILA